MRHLLLGLTTGLVLSLPGLACAQTPPALAGTVTSAAEGPMEGVLVSAKKAGGTITITVVSDAQGHYSFPAAKLDPGHYALAIRAGGYDLDKPRAADVATGQTATADIALNKAKNLSAQLSGAEWLTSMPGPELEKQRLLNCADCHSLQRILQSTHNAAEFRQVFDRMAGYYPGAEPLSPQRLVGDAKRPAVEPGHEQEFADYLANVNLSGGRETWNFPLKTDPRPTGRATHVIYTEYDLPRAVIQPHDVIVDEDGMVWYSNFGEQFLSKLDPKTGKVTEYPIPVQKPGYPTGTLDLERDQQGNLWIALMYQSGVARFDKATGTFKIFPLPASWQRTNTQQAFLTPTASKVDGKVWVKQSGGAEIYRFDLATGTYENLGSFKDPISGHTVGTYGIPGDSKNNIYLLDFGSSDIVKLDAQTKKATFYRTPTANSHPRRGRADAQDRIWFAEYFGDAIGVLDTKTEEIKEWKIPTKWTSPYDVVTDKNGEAWTGSVMSDRIARLDPKTGQFVEYLLPRETNTRRVFVDNSTTPVTFWTGSDHGASIIKLEPTE